MKKLFLILMVFYIVSIKAQTPQLVYTKQFNKSSTSTDLSSKIKVDNQGNSWVIGQSDNSGAGIDWMAVKRDKNGDTLWTKRFDGPANGEDIPADIVLDLKGNCYIVGTVETSANGKDIAVVSYNTNGKENWHFEFTYDWYVVNNYSNINQYDEVPIGIGLDLTNNYVLVAGTGNLPGQTDKDILMFSVDMANGKEIAELISQGDLYFDPNAGYVAYEDIAYAMTVKGDRLYIAAEQRSGGNNYYSRWEIFRFQSTNTGWVNDVATYWNGNKYILYFQYPFTTLYSGDQNYPTTIAVDGNGNIYVSGIIDTIVSTGTYNKIATIEISNSQHAPKWKTHYDSGNGDIKISNDIKVDGTNGNVYITGYENNSSGNKDYVTIKYDNSGQEIWKMKKNGGGNGDDVAYSLALDIQRNPIVTGGIKNSAGDNDIYTIKYNKSNGAKIWDIVYDANYDETGSTIVQVNDDIYITGSTTTSNQSANFLTLKYCASWPTADAGADVSICTGGSIKLKATGGSYYSWTPSAGLSATNISSPIASPTSTTKYYVSVYESYGCVATDSITVSVSSQIPNTPTIIKLGNLLSSSSSTGNQWYRNDVLIAGAVNQNYNVPTPIIVPQCYSVTVTNTFGCTSAKSDTICYAPKINNFVQLSSEDFFSITPNPASNIITINYPTSLLKTEYTIYNILGEVVFKDIWIPNQTQKDIDITILPKGVYIIRLGNIVQKLVKE